MVCVGDDKKIAINHLIWLLMVAKQYHHKCLSLKKIKI